MTIKVKKRDGRIVNFDEGKIRIAMIKGFLDYGDMTGEKEDAIKNT